MMITKKVIPIILILTGISSIFYFYKVDVQDQGIQGKSIPWGSYGTPFVTFNTPKTKRRLLLLGNSVFQSTMLVPELIKLNNKNGNPLEIINAGVTGASIGDLIFNFMHARKSSPDILLTILYPDTFSTSSPLFRNTSNQLFFTSEMSPLWGEMKLLSLFEDDKLAEALLFSHIPFYKKYFFIKNEASLLINRFINKLAKTNNLKQPFSVSTLNMVDHWTRNNRSHLMNQRTSSESGQFEESEYLMELFLRLTSEIREVLIVQQENSHSSLPIFNKIEQMTLKYANTQYYDHKKHYNKSYFRDSIHPNTKGAKIVALRIWNLLEGSKLGI